MIERALQIEDAFVSTLAIATDWKVLKNVVVILDVFKRYCREKYHYFQNFSFYSCHVQSHYMQVKVVEVFRDHRNIPAL